MVEIRIKELGEIYTGKTPPTENSQNFGFTYPFVTPVDLKDDKYIIEAERYVSEIGIKHTTLIPKNSICVSCIGYIGKISITTTDSCTNQQINSIVVNKEYFVDYVYYLLSYNVPYFKELAGVNVVPQLNKRDFSKIKLQATKNKPEQTAIATILSKVDEAIEATQNSIKAAEKLKKALMQNLLSGKLKPDGTWRTDDEFYVDEKFGKVPKGWILGKVKKVIKLKNGKGNTTSNLKNEPDTEYNIPVFGGNGITGYYHTALLTEPTLIIGRVGEYCGNVFLTPKNSWVTDNAMLVEKFLIEDYSLDFFKYKFNTLNFIYYSDTTGQPKLTQGSIGSISFIYPESKIEQTEIAEKINSVELKITEKQTKIQILQRLKKSLMQNLLTGKVRLPAEFIKQFESDRLENTIRQSNQRVQNNE
jgi:type I restriction enzyme, S subunit